MKKTFRILMVLILTGLALMPIFANGTSDASSSSAKKTITVWDGNWSEDAFQKIKVLWNEKYPDIELVGEF